MADTTSLLPKLQALLIENLGCDAEQIYPEQTLEALGMDSLDQVELVMAMEEEFGVCAQDDESSQWQTIADVLAYLEEAAD